MIDHSFMITAVRAVRFFLLPAYLSFYLCGCVTSIDTEKLNTAAAVAGTRNESPMFFNEGNRFEKNGKWLEARNHYRTALWMDPENSMTLYALGRTEAMLYMLAEKAYQEGLKYRQAAVDIQAEEKFSEALRYWPQHLGLQKDFLPIVQAEKSYQKGLEDILQGRKQGAERHFIDALAAWPQHFAALKMLSSKLSNASYDREIREEAARQYLFQAFGADFLNEYASDQGYFSIPALPRNYILHSIRPKQTPRDIVFAFYGDLSHYSLFMNANPFLSDLTRVRPGMIVRIPMTEKMRSADPFVFQPAYDGLVDSRKDETRAKTSASVEFFNSGMNFFYDGEYSKALSAFQESLKGGLNEKLCREYAAECNFRIGLERFDKKDYGSAKNEFREALRYDPNCRKCKDYIKKCEENDSVGYYSQALELYEAGKYPEAIAVLKKSIKNYPNDNKAPGLAALCHLQRGKGHYEAKNFLAAKKEFENALSYDKTCEECSVYSQKIDDYFAGYKQEHYDKGFSFLSKRELSKAVQEWELVYAIDPNYKQVEKNLTTAKELLKRLQKIKKNKS
ncbi:MAG: hypothetical protein EHM45_01155 [Desulfobacteraceae bacterium]|nr:MAG: hypothetical protein EHM45_01155 [Desulfobacteraceae bacterium]